MPPRPKPKKYTSSSTPSPAKNTGAAAGSAAADPSKPVKPIEKPVPLERHEIPINSSQVDDVYGDAHQKSIQTLLREACQVRFCSLRRSLLPCQT